MTHSLAAWVAAFFLAVSLFSGTVALRLMLLLAGVALCAWVIYRNRSIRVLPPVWLPFLAWAAWAALSLLWSIDVPRSGKEFRNEIVYASLALWMCFVASQARSALRVFSIVVASGSIAACLVALYYYNHRYSQYSMGVHGGAGFHSSVLLMVTPAALVAALYGRGTKAPRFTTGFAVLLITLYILSAYTTLNRTVWIGLGLQSLLIGAIYSRSLPHGGTRIAMVLALFAIAGAAFFLTWKVQLEREANFGLRPLHQDARLAIWREATERIEKKPWTGYGFGRGHLRKELATETNDGLAWHAHNLFLDLALQVGIPGLLIFLALLAATAYAGLRLAKDQDRIVIACGVTLIALLVGMIVRNLTDVLWVRHIALFYWGMVGVLFGLSYQRVRTR